MRLELKFTHRTVDISIFMPLGFTSDRKRERYRLAIPMAGRTSGCLFHDKYSYIEGEGYFYQDNRRPLRSITSFIRREPPEH